MSFKNHSWPFEDNLKYVNAMFRFILNVFVIKVLRWRSTFDRKTLTSIEDLGEYWQGVWVIGFLLYPVITAVNVDFLVRSLNFYSILVNGWIISGSLSIFEYLAINLLKLIFKRFEEKFSSLCHFVTGNIQVIYNYCLQTSSNQITKFWLFLLNLI